MAFHYKFETLLNVRKIQENMAQQAFSHAQRHLAALAAMKEQVMARKEVLRAEMMTRMKGGLSSCEVKSYSDYLHHLDGGIERINENMEKAQRLLDERREELLKAKRAYKAILRLKEIHQARHEEAERKKEMKFLDEIAIMNAGGGK
ncbi:MAG: flagellar export protein FliJ [Desulfobacterota bacterium]|jgi:flagellar FliJ protein|nr:flagellar export protein FliJ [Thermodesulfobacteriota bacterium]